MSSTSGYNGNPNLPKAGARYNLTPDQIVEFKKCMDDPVYFAENYFKIVHIDHGIVPFKLYPYQADAVKLAQSNRKLVVNASRQSGKTSIATVIILHYALFNEDKKIALLANKGEMAREILSRIQLAYEYLPLWLKCGVKEWNKGSVEFDNGTKIIAAASSSSAVRGQSISLLYIDECAFVPNWEEFSASVLPTLSSGNQSRLIYTSTPNGLNHFFEYCEGAKKDANGFAYLEVPWWKVPGRDEEWKETMLGMIGHDQEKFEVEFNCEFMGSSGTLLSGACLKRLEHKQPIHINHGYGYKVYEEPKPNHNYVLVADVSRGKGLDYSAFQVIDISEVPYRQVATFKNNMITPIDYAEYIYRTVVAYNNAYVLVEVNDIGAQVSDLLHFDYEYEYVLKSESAGRAGKRIFGGFGKSNFDRGIRTTTQVKSTGCSMLKLLIEQNKLLIVDIETIRELSVFSKKGNSYEAESGHHDDLVMGLVLFAWLSQDDFFKGLTDDNIMHHLREQSEEDIMENLTSFGFSVDGTDYYEHQTEYGGYRTFDDGF